MLSQAQNLSFSETGTALESAVRESDEIKSLSPPYNRALREDDRTIVFYSGDLSKWRSKPDRDHPLGPFPSNIRMDALAGLMDLMNGKIRRFPPRFIQKVLAVPPEYTPGTSCFEEGLAAFKKEFLHQVDAGLSLSRILALGARFWREKLDWEDSQALLKEAGETEEEEKEEVGDEKIEGRDEADRSVWRPERVVKALKRVIMICSLYTRRSRWHCRLIDSTLRWDKAASIGAGKNELTLERGVPSFAYEVSIEKRIFRPSGHRRPLLERQKCFDIVTYDRMTVVTSEIRRIVQEGRDVELCFLPDRVFGNLPLSRMLRWV
jgi:hypothetical protein